MSIKKRVQGNYTIESLVNPGNPITKPNHEGVLVPSTIHPELHETIIKTSFLTIDGDLLVLGDSVIQNVDQIVIKDPVLTFNSVKDDNGEEEVDAIPQLPEYNFEPIAGMAINRGRQFDSNGIPDPSLDFRLQTLIRYNDTGADGTGTATDEGYWEATNNGIDYYRLDANSSFKLEDDLDPHLGGHLIANGFRITTTQTINDPDAIPPGNPNDIIIEASNNLSLSATRIESTPLGLEIQTNDPALNPGYNTIYGKAVGSGGTGLYVRNQDRVEELVSRSKAIVFGLIF